MPFPYKALGEYRVLYVEPNGRLWVSRGLKILYSNDCGETFIERAAVKPVSLLNYFAASRLVSRVIRAGILSLLPLAGDAVLIAVRGQLLRCSPGSREFRPVLSVPGRTLKIEQLPGGPLYAAEYFYNRDRGPVRVFASLDEGVTWEVVYTFASGTIRHVHALTHDPFRQALLVLTGDRDPESKVLKTTNHFQTLDVLSAGSQKSRAVGVIPLPGGYLLPTDTPYEQNYIQFLGLDGKIRPCIPIAGSCLSVCQVGGWAFFGTAVEPSSVNRDPNAVLYGADTRYGTPDSLEWFIIGRWHVDIFSWPNRLQASLFQMARILLPAGVNQSGFLFATTVGVKHNDGVLHRWSVQ
jgi:hypothetical protein